MQKGCNVILKKYGKKFYISAFVLSIISTILLIVGIIFYAITGRDGLITLIVLSVSATIFALLGIVLIIIDIKLRKNLAIAEGLKDK